MRCCSSCTRCRATHAGTSSAAGSTTSPATRCATRRGGWCPGSTAGTSSSPGPRCSAWPSRTSTSSCSPRTRSPTFASSDGALLMELEKHEYDVVVVGAGGAGLRAAIEAHESGARTAVVCKSLLGKAHTVMAEGGIAAAMANLYPEDNWRVHFRDTMRGGKMLNHWRMAQLHAQEAPDRVRELEDWGALFDRTKDGLISQRDFGGHRYARLAHVGDRTGLELIRTLQQRTVALGIDVYMECTVTRLLTGSATGCGEREITGAFGYWRESGR